MNVNSARGSAWSLSGPRSKFTWAALAIVFSAPVAGIRAQSTGGAAAASAPAKNCVINVRNTPVATAEGEEAQRQLQTQFSTQQKKLQNNQHQNQDNQRP